MLLSINKTTLRKKGVIKPITDHSERTKLHLGEGLTNVTSGTPTWIRTLLRMGGILAHTFSLASLRFRFLHAESPDFSSMLSHLVHPAPPMTFAHLHYHHPPAYRCIHDFLSKVYIPFSCFIHSLLCV